MLKKFIRNVKRNRRFYLMLTFAAFNTLALATPACAADFTQGGKKLMRLIVNLDAVISTLTAAWSIIEAQLGYPNWKPKLMASVVGFIAISLLPWFFEAIDSALND